MHESGKTTWPCKCVASIDIRHGKRHLCHLAVSCLLLALLPGCSLWRQMRQPVPLSRQSYSSGMTAEEVVHSLNRGLVKSWKCSDTKISGRVGVMPMPELASNFAVESPQRLRLVAKNSAATADIGSNEEEVWVLLNMMGGGKQFITVDHQDMPLVRNCGELPFEPDWLMEVLRVKPFSPVGARLIEGKPRSNEVNLIYESSSRDKKPVYRVVVYDTKNSRVKRYLLRDASGHVLMQADLRKYADVDGYELPHHVDLRLNGRKTHLSIRFKDIEVNPSTPLGLWQKPQPRTISPINLGQEIRMRSALDGIDYAEGMSGRTTPAGMPTRQAFAEPSPYERYRNVSGRIDQAEEPPWAE